jgi:alcohol dehydrogenase YqhD (iron-dependent ADH family)
MEGMKMPETVEATSDERTVNNVMRHAYRVLTDAEKAAMQKIKDDGLAMHNFFDSLGVSRELSVAKTKIEEAVMWAVKHITA